MSLYQFFFFYILFLYSVIFPGEISPFTPCGAKDIRNNCNGFGTDAVWKALYEYNPGENKNGLQEVNYLYELIFYPIAIDHDCSENLLVYYYRMTPQTDSNTLWDKNFRTFQKIVSQLTGSWHQLFYDSMEKFKANLECIIGEKIIDQWFFDPVTAVDRWYPNLYTFICYLNNQIIDFDLTTINYISDLDAKNYYNKKNQQKTERKTTYIDFLQSTFIHLSDIKKAYWLFNVLQIEDFFMSEVIFPFFLSKVRLTSINYDTTKENENNLQELLQALKELLDSCVTMNDNPTVEESLCFSYVKNYWKSNEKKAYYCLLCLMKEYFQTEPIGMNGIAVYQFMKYHIFNNKRILPLKTEPFADTEVPQNQNTDLTDQFRNKKKIEDKKFEFMKYLPEFTKKNIGFGIGFITLLGFAIYAIKYPQFFKKIFVR